jgi:hypothetical protein
MIHADFISSSFFDFKSHFATYVKVVGASTLVSSLLQFDEILYEEP